MHVQLVKQANLNYNISSKSSTDLMLVIPNDQRIKNTKQMKLLKMMSSIKNIEEVVTDV